MNNDDLEPPNKKPVPKNLAVMSIGALGTYIKELEAEISRARAEIEAKEIARQGAEDVFKK